MPKDTVIRLMTFRSLGEFMEDWLHNAASPGTRAGHLEPL
jgi:hypothetical protein